MTTVVLDLLDAHAQGTRELASAHRQLAMLRATRFEAWARSWVVSEGFGVTERQNRCTADCATLDAEISRAQGERDALIVELHHAGLVLQYADAER
mgnify:CR=1 FL=1